MDDLFGSVWGSVASTVGELVGDAAEEFGREVAGELLDDEEWVELAASAVSGAAALGGKVMVEEVGAAVWDWFTG